MLLNCVKALEISIMKQIELQLEKGKRYLKTSYGLHCSNNTTVASHCISCALFHPEDKDYQPSTCETHPDKCQDCTDLLICINQIETLVNQLPDSEEKSELSYDLNLSVESIKNWIQHISRSVQQNKEYAMNNLDLKTGLWLSDWSQKILPVAYREGQKEYFGKKGMSMHIDCLLIMVLHILMKELPMIQMKYLSKKLMPVLGSDNVIRKH